MAKLHALVAEGYFENYGSENYLIGIYDDLDKLNKAQDDYVELIKKENFCPGKSDENIRSWYTKVLEVELNETHPLSKTESQWTDYELINDLYIGGYEE